MEEAADTEAGALTTGVGGATGAGATGFLAALPSLEGMNDFRVFLIGSTSAS